MAARERYELSERRACRIVSQPRGTQHYVPTVRIESDFRNVEYANLPGPFNVYLFDGPHEAIDQFQGLSLPLPCFGRSVRLY